MYQPTSDALLAAGRQNTESARPTRLRIDVTPDLGRILRDAYLSTLGRVSESERQYVLDASRGHYQTVDLHRVALVVRRSPRPGLRREFWTCVKGIVADDQRPVLPATRAHLRRAIEQGEALQAVETYRYQPCPVKAERVIRENNDLIVALEDENAAIAAEHQLSA